MTQPDSQLLWKCLPTEAALGAFKKPSHLWVISSRKSAPWHCFYPNCSFPGWSQRKETCIFSHSDSCKRSQWKCPAQPISQKTIDLTRIMVKGQARNCNLKHSLAKKWFYFSLPKCYQKNKTKQKQKQNTMAPCCHQFTCIHHRGKVLIGRHFSVSFLRLWGQCYTAPWFSKTESPITLIMQLQHQSKGKQQPSPI